MKKCCVNDCNKEVEHTVLDNTHPSEWRTVTYLLCDDHFKHYYPNWEKVKP